MDIERPVLFAADGQRYDAIDVLTEHTLDHPIAIHQRIVQWPVQQFACQTATIEVLRANLGLAFEAGWFLTDLPEDSPKDRFKDHAWNSLGRRIVDLTAYQYNDLLIEPLPRTIIIVETGSPLL